MTKQKPYRIRTQKVRLVHDATISSYGNRASTPAESANLFRAVFEGLPHEEVWCACLNTQLELIALTRVSQGGTLGAGILPADVLRPVIVSGATSFVIAHNHPSGHCALSEGDHTVAEALKRASEYLGVTMLDFLVMTSDGRYHSWAAKP
jgi:DNA repair protein RadC